MLLGEFRVHTNTSVLRNTCFHPYRDEFCVNAVCDGSIDEGCRDIEEFITIIVAGEVFPKHAHQESADTCGRHKVALTNLSKNGGKRNVWPSGHV